MNHNITLLIELRDKYTKALETEDVPTNLSLGICFAIDAFCNIGSPENYSLKSLLYELVDEGKIIVPVNDGSWEKRHLWPTIHNNKVSVAEALLPRIEALNIMIKNLSDGAK